MLIIHFMWNPLRPMCTFLPLNISAVSSVLRQKNKYRFFSVYKNMREQEKKIEKIWARISRLWQISKAKIVYSSKRIYRHLSGRFFLYTKGKWMFISIKDMFLITRHHHGKYIQMMKCNLIWQVTFKILLLTAWLVCAVVELQPISGFFE